MSIITRISVSSNFCKLSKIYLLVPTTRKIMSIPEEHQFSKDFLFRQLFDRESSTYTYLLADTNTKEAVLIDPVLELAERDAQLVKQQGLKLIYCMNTHMHADHVTGTGKLKQLIPGCQSVISRSSGAKADILLDPESKVKFGRHELIAKPTPGHTNGCMTYISFEQGIAFTGDTVLIRGCGRTDFQEGDPETLYKSVHKQIFSLPDNFKLFPAHDYKGLTVTTVWEEKLYNARLTKSLPEFIDIMNNLNLAYPKKMGKLQMTSTKSPPMTDMQCAVTSLDLQHNLDSEESGDGSDCLEEDEPLPDSGNTEDTLRYIVRTLHSMRKETRAFTAELEVSKAMVTKAKAEPDRLVQENNDLWPQISMLRDDSRRLNDCSQSSTEGNQAIIAEPKVSEATVTKVEAQPDRLVQEKNDLSSQSSILRGDDRRLNNYSQSPAKENQVVPAELEVPEATVTKVKAQPNKRKRSRISMLRDDPRRLEDSIRRMGDESRYQNLLFYNVPATETSEEAVSVVQALAVKLQIALTLADVNDCHPLPKGARRIMCRFTTEFKRDEFLAAMKAKKITTSAMGWPGDDLPVRVFEHLTTDTCKLLVTAKSRLLRKNGGRFRYVWQTRGHILLREHRGAKTREVKTIEDIDKLCR